MSKSAALLVRILEIRDHLSDDERDLVRSLPDNTRRYEHLEEIVRIGDRPKQSCIVVDGLAARTHYLENGGRQFSAVHTPGDFVDLHSFTLKKMDHAVVAIGPCTIATVPHEDLTRITSNNPHLTRMLWLLTTIDAAVERAWIVAGGRMTAEGRLAHLICELITKLKAVGVIEENSFLFPIRQQDLADMLGMSVVHTNRTLQALRKKKLLSWDGERMTVPKFDDLAEAGQFDPAYLYLTSEPR